MRKGRLLKISRGTCVEGMLSDVANLGNVAPMTSMARPWDHVRSTAESIVFATCMQRNDIYGPDDNEGQLTLDERMRYAADRGCALAKFMVALEIGKSKEEGQRTEEYYELIFRCLGRVEARVAAEASKPYRGAAGYIRS